MRRQFKTRSLLAAVAVAACTCATSGFASETAAQATDIPNSSIAVGAPTLWSALTRRPTARTDADTAGEGPLNPAAKVTDRTARAAWARRLGKRANTLPGALSLCAYENPTYECVRNVGVLSVLAYKAAAGDREAFADFDATLTAFGLGGAMLGQAHWSARDTLGWWWGAGAMGVVYDELSNTKLRAQLYGAGAEATQKAIEHSQRLHAHMTVLKDIDPAKRWDSIPLYQGQDMTLSSFLTHACDDSLASEAPEGLDKAQLGAVLKYQVALQTQCNALGAAHKKLQTAKRIWAGEDEILALGLEADLNAIDAAVARADRLMRARSTEVGGVIIRSAANVLASLAVKLTQADASGPSYTIQRSGFAAENLTLHGLPDCTLPDPVDEAFPVAEFLERARIARQRARLDKTHPQAAASQQDTYFAELADQGEALNEIAVQLNDRIARAQALARINSDRTYQFRIGETAAQRPAGD